MVPTSRTFSRKSSRMQMRRLNCKRRGPELESSKNPFIQKSNHNEQFSAVLYKENVSVHPKFDRF